MALSSFWKQHLTRSDDRAASGLAFSQPGLRGATEPAVPQPPPPVARRCGPRGELRVGTSGYQYRHWRGSFYPGHLPVDRWFAYYAARFDTVEIDATFYGLPEAGVFDAWREQAPPGFRYALKYSRYATHWKHLASPEEALERFLERAERLRARLGPILVQLPPRWHADAARLDAFLRAAPRRHRYAVELRDASWLCEQVYAVLRRRGAALVIHDLLERHPDLLTADFAYLRFHGHRYGGSYPHQALAAQARRIRRWLRTGRDVYVYFNNDRGGHAPRNAADLRRYVEAGRSARSGVAGSGAGPAECAAWPGTRSDRRRDAPKNGDPR
jgi:uncharacterized protein YecE (DUF72 family)